MTTLPDNVKVVRTSESAGITHYDVMVDGEKVGTLWKVAGRSFSGAWRGQVDGGRFINWQRTRREVVEKVTCVLSSEQID